MCLTWKHLMDAKWNLFTLWACSENFDSFPELPGIGLSGAVLSPLRIYYIEQYWVVNISWSEENSRGQKPFHKWAMEISESELLFRMVAAGEALSQPQCLRSLTEEVRHCFSCSSLITKFSAKRSNKREGNFGWR